MPQYIFHIETEEKNLAEFEFADRAAARAEAIKTAGAILKDIDGSFIGPHWVMRVEEIGEGDIFELRFSVTEGR